MEVKSAPSPLTDEVAAFRRFNRMYTRFIGTLREGHLATRYSLTESRLIYELATRKTSKAKDLADALDLDAGYLSRLVERFELAGLLKREACERDSRSVELSLTNKGKLAFRKLNTRSDKQAQTILEGLGPPRRSQLIRSMRAIEDIISGTERTSSPIVLRPHRIGDMGLVVSREAAGYAQEYGWDETFEVFAARVVADFIAEFDPNRERCWIAEVDGHHVGHIFLMKHPNEADTAKLRFLFVEPSARGKGVARALVSECIRFAKASGYRRVVLWTQSILGTALRIYREAGFTLLEEQTHRSFGKELVGQTWALQLEE